MLIKKNNYFIAKLIRNFSAKGRFKQRSEGLRFSNVYKFNDIRSKKYLHTYLSEFSFVFKITEKGISSRKQESFVT